MSMGLYRGRYPAFADEPEVQGADSHLSTPGLEETWVGGLHHHSEALIFSWFHHTNHLSYSIASLPTPSSRVSASLSFALLLRTLKTHSSNTENEGSKEYQELGEKAKRVANVPVSPLPACRRGWLLPFTGIVTSPPKKAGILGCWRGPASARPPARKANAA